MFSRFGNLSKVLSNCGTNFTPELMKEVAQFLSVHQLHITPYHLMANGIADGTSEVNVEAHVCRETE